MGGNVGGLSRLPALFVCIDMFVGPSDVIHTVGLLPRSISDDPLIVADVAEPGSLLVLNTPARDLASRNGDAILIWCVIISDAHAIN